MLYIYAVHKNSQTGAIEKLRYLQYFNANVYKECTKRDMVVYVERNPSSVKTLYFTNGTRKEGEFVHVVDHEYLRTDANNIKADNLGELIEY